MRANALVRAGLNDWKRRSPASFWRVRNSAALARWFWTRAQRRLGSNDSNYDEAFWTDQDGDWDGVAELVRAIVNPRSIVDVGCGQGLLLEALRRPAEYWQARFAGLGYELGARDQQFRARLRMIDLPWWYADNAHAFERATGGSWRAAGS